MPDQNEGFTRPVGDVAQPSRTGTEDHETVSTDSRNDQAPVDPAGSGSSASAERKAFMDDTELLAEIDRRRGDEAFMARLRERIAEDRKVLLRLADEPFLVESGWVDSVLIAHTGGPSYRVLRYADGRARFEHRCDRGERGVIICAPLLQLSEPGGHRIVQTAPLTIEPSILCPDCGTHGFVRQGRWVAA